MQVLDYILNHLEFIVTLIVFIVGAIRIIAKFGNLSKEEQIKQVKGFLLQAVIAAEKELGSKTGKIKLSKVYAEFCEAMPWCSRYLSYEEFCKLVDETLEDMKHLIESNQAIAGMIENKEN